jgi:hypothetical protein
MNREILKDVSMNGSVDLVSAIDDSLTNRAKRVHDLLGREPLASSTSPEESLVIDDRCDMSPAQMVETKLTRVLGGSTLPVSHLQMRGLLRKR